MKNFDRFVGIDWTGAKSPIISKAIAVSECTMDVAPTLINQKWSRQLVCNYIESLLSGNQRILIGIDCNFGYASEILEHQIGKHKTAFDLWAEIDQHCVKDPNFFAGGFWQHGSYKSYFWTEGKMKNGFQMPMRQTEIHCRQNGFGHPESPFKMIGAKQVGKGGLSGMRLAYYLKKKHQDKIAIWPFDNDDICNNAKIVITEIYPRQFIIRAGFGNKKLRTSDDLNNALHHLKSKPFNGEFDSDHDSDAIISAAGLRYLCGHNKTIPNALSNPHNDSILLKQEGWIFGI